jgi:diguanylate cyclase (GGDEF)-like protein
MADAGADPGGVGRASALLTARSEDLEKVRGLRAGADDYLGKPFQQDELEARIEAVLRRSQLATRDALTGLPNRRAFDEHLDTLFRRGGEQEFALVLFDLDHFKQINDSQGHQEGDRVLRDVARLALRQVRLGEELFRVGGEEFAIVIASGRAGGVLVAERVRAAVADERRSEHLPTLSRNARSSHTPQTGFACGRRSGRVVQTQ